MKNYKNIEKLKIIFWALGLDIGGKKDHFLKGLKIPYLSIFFSPSTDNIKAVKKIKKNIEKSKMILFGS